MISVTTCSPNSDIAAAWTDLAARASSNAFMHPAALRAAEATGFADIRVLLAWDDAATPRRLIGLWALRIRRIAPFWPLVLDARPYNYAFLSTPVVDPAYAVAVMPAFLAAIQNDPDLPKVLHLHSFEQEVPCYASLARELAATGGAHRMLMESQRPFATREDGIKKSGSTRKKLRQDWNRLSATGSVDVVNDRTPAAVMQAFETFLALEQASWKGARGTALLCDAADAAFVRQLMHNLSAEGHASVALLRVDGQPIAAQVLMYGGDTAYTWKTAFDTAYARYSPGMLLVDKITEQLFADPAIGAIDSCSSEDGFMAKLWTGRRQVVEMLIHVGPGSSAAFALEQARLLGYHEARRLRNQWRARRAAPAPQAKAPLARAS
ncbi:MAG TPA: GNAT family N-acetyltransferase [Xanthobacteraceae bacterium]|nr:GNAT family N-acetyltransferase [Xanthobacteraceae bacterium]